jgi:hypothetical protein
VLRLAALSVVPLFLTGPAAAAIDIALLKRGVRRGLWIFWVLLVGATVLLGVTVAHTFGDFFPGLGCITTLLTPASAVVTLLVFRLSSKHFESENDAKSDQRRRFQAAMLLIPALQLSVPLIGWGYAQGCALGNRRAARPIVQALDQYHRDHGHYPSLPGRHHSDLQILDPEYLEAIPSRPCRNPFARLYSYPLDDDWSLYFCANNPGQETLLLVPLIGTDSKQIYNPETRWWRRGNSLDGYCP